MRTPLKPIILTFCIIFTSQAALAQENDFQTSYNKCKKKTNSAERLKCFDDLENDTKAQKTNAEGKGGLEPNPTPTNKEFGSEDIKKSESQRREEKETREITIGLLGVGKNNIGKNVFYLENGHVWRQVSEDRTVSISPRKLESVEVTIRRKMFNSHFLRFKGRSFKVERIK